MVSKPDKANYPVVLQDAQALYEDYVRVAQLAESVGTNDGQAFFTATLVADSTPILPTLQVWVS